jgi:NADH-quinone oxidoreductase subunit J
MKTGAAEWGISLFVGLALFGVLAVTGWYYGRPAPIGDVQKYAPKTNLSAEPAQARYTDAFGLLFSGVGLGPAHDDPNQKDRPIIRTSYLLPFEIVSVHLLVVLIGAAYLARAKRRARTRGNTP